MHPHLAPAFSTWTPDPTRILTRRELALVLDAARESVTKSVTARRNLTIFRLSCCCGLRVSEISGLKLHDLVTAGGRPHLRLRAATTKGKKPRVVPLWWDAGTLADLVAWKEVRLGQGAGPNDPFICCVYRHRQGQALQRAAVRRRFLQACKVLGAERLKMLTIHHGRHTFISHALAGGRTLAEVKAAAGHASIAVTSAYVHIAVDDECQAGNLFAW